MRTSAYAAWAEGLAPSRKSLLAAGLVLVFTLAAYSNSFDAEFHFDDFHQLVRNQNVRSLGNVPGFFKEAGLGSYQPGTSGFRPVTYASFALSYALTGYEVRGYHVFNLAVHLINSFLVFLIVGASLRQAGREGFWPALASSLVFALHPVQTNAVTYVSGRAVLLASLFFLAGFYSSLRFRVSEGRRSYAWACAVPALYLLGLLSKEMAVSLPAAILAYELIFAGHAKGVPAARAGRYAVPALCLAVLALYLAWKKSVQGFFATSDSLYGTTEYLMSEAKAFLLYMRLLVLPVNQNADYNLPPTQAVDPLLVLSAALVMLALACLYRLRKAEPAAAFFGSWFFVSLAPESTLFPIADIAVEYRLYLPSVGFVAALCILAAGSLRHPWYRRALMAAPIAMFGLLTFGRNAVWANGLSLWGDVARKAPGSARAHAGLGGALMDERRWMEAVREFDLALGLNPYGSQSYESYNNLGICFSNMGMRDEAVGMFARAAQVRPDYVEAYSNLGRAYIQMGRYGEAAEALGTAVRLNPGYAEARINLAACYTAIGRDRDALAEMLEALRLSPKDFIVNYDLAVIYNNNGMAERAAEQARAALELAGDGAQRAKAEALMARLGRDG